MPTQDLVHRFLTAFDQLDAVMREHLGRGPGDAHAGVLEAFATKNSVVRRERTTLRRCAELRNLLQHAPDRARFDPFATPNEKLVERYEEIVRAVVNEPRAGERSVARSKLFVATLSDPVVATMETMAVRGYSQVPVLDDERIIGVFSESTPFAIVAETKELLLDRSWKLDDIRKHLAIDRQINERFEFIARAARWTSVEELFTEMREQGRRLGAVFVTENGKPNERLLGMITPWDLA